MQHSAGLWWGRPLRRGHVALAVVLSLVAVLGGVVSGSPAQAAPGSPGVTHPGTLLYSEDFSNVDASVTPARIGSYTGGPAADGETYSADAAWSPGANACNGWIMRKGTALPPNGGSPVVTNNDQCDRNQGFAHLGDMAEEMGLYQGMSPAAAAQNQVLSEYTNSVNGTQAAGVQLQTTNNSIPTVAGHFYAVSAIFAETNCFSNHAKQELSLMVNGVPVVLGSNLDPCTDPSAVAYEGGNVSVAKLQSNALQVPLTGTTPTLGIRVRNLAATGTGNDVGFDLPQIVDVTPQLDKQFSPSTVTQGVSSTLTFTVTNTSDLMAKNGWSFTDNLPSGLVASGPVGGTCQLTASSVTSGSISATGNLAQGQASCTISVQVKSNTPGVYTNSGCTDNAGAAIPSCTNNVPTIVGLYPPGSTSLTVLPEVDLSITKSADLNSYTPGQPITYTVTVHNAGPSDAIDATFVDPVPAAVTGATWTCAVTAAGSPVLAPNGPTTCGATSGSGDVSDTVRLNVGGTLTYTVTGTVAAGTTAPITNKATITPPATTVIPVQPGGGPNPTPGSTKTVPTVDPGCPPAPGAGCSASVTTPGSAIKVVKSITSVTDTNNDNLVDASDVIHYKIVTTNTGDSTLTAVTVTDVLTPPAGPALTLSCTPSLPATLAPNATITCTADYVITAADVQTGSIDNSVTATGTPPNGPKVTSTDTATQPTTTPDPGLSLVKSASITTDANNDGKAGVGDQITFSFHVANTGNVTMTGITVDDQLVAPAGPAVSVTCPSTSLAPGASMDCTSSVYVVTQADVDKGEVDNSATATGTPPTGPPVTTEPSTTTTPTPTPAPALSLLKTAAITKDANNDGKAGVGDEVTFTFHVANTGNVTMTGITVDDQLVPPAAPEVSVICPTTTLAPGASMDCVSSAYVVTQADVDAGSIDNAATATGTPPKGPPVTTKPSTTTTPTPNTPTLTLLKTAAITKDANHDGKAGVGDEITFTFRVANAGTVTLQGITVDDQLVAPAGPAVSVTCPSTSLAPGASMDCTSSVYVVTQADVDKGKVGNSATATGTPPTGPPVTTEPSKTSTPTPNTPDLSLVKSAAITKDANHDGKAGVDDEITFSFTIKNTGTVTLHGVTVDDQLVSPAGPAVSVTCPASTIAPGDTLVCTSSVYVVTQADVDKGKVENAATATGTPPTGPPVTTEPSKTSTPTPDKRDLSIVKTAAITKDANHDGKAGVGDEITFTFHVANTGDVTLHDVSVDDQLVAPAGPAVSVACPSTTLAPGASMDCTSSTYVVTQADVDASSVDNAATATGTPPTGPPVTTEPSTTTTPTPVAAPGLSIVKTAAITKDANHDGKAGVDDEITFAFHVANTGNVTLTEVTVDDGSLAVLGIEVTCPSTTLAPGAEMDCTSAPYVVTQADIDAGRVRNVATAEGTPPPGGSTGTVKSPPSVVEVPTVDVPDQGGSLAFTGSNVLLPAGVGLLLLVAGLLLVVAARRRRESVDG